MATFGNYPSTFVVPANHAMRRNAADSAFETFDTTVEVAPTYKRLTITGAARISVTNSNRLKVTDHGDCDSVIIGTPQLSRVNFTIPHCYVADMLTRLTLTMRATIQGLGRLVITDDFGTRSRIVLTGRG